MGEKVRLLRVRGQGVHVHVIGADVVAVGNRPLPLPRLAVPVDAPLGSVSVRQLPAGGGVQQLDVALLGTVRREGQPRLKVRLRVRADRRGNGGPDGDVGTQVAVFAHGGNDLVPHAVGRLGGKAPGIHVRVEAQRLRETIQIIRCTVDIPPVDAVGGHQRVKFRFGKIRHILPQQRDGVGAGKCVVFRDAPHDLPAGQQRPFGLLGQTFLLQKQVDAGVGGSEIPGAVVALHLGGQSHRHIGKPAVFVHVAHLTESVPGSIWR